MGVVLLSQQPEPAPIRLRVGKARSFTRAGHLIGHSKNSKSSGGGVFD